MPTLIEPLKSGAELAREIADARPDTRSLCVWWLGQSGFVIKGAFGTLAIDPYLSDSLTRKYARTDRPHVRMTRMPIAPDALAPVDLILCSHKHTDHMDAETLLPMLERNPAAMVGLPTACAEHAAAIGLPPRRTVLLDAGDVIHHAGFRVRAIASAHERIETDGRGCHHFLGFVVECGPGRLYHSGDTVLHERLVADLGEGPFDILFLPINGRDPARGVPGNMTASEAVELTLRILPRHVVPHHYDMFTFNTVQVSTFETEARRLPPQVVPVVLKCGERWEVSL